MLFVKYICVTRAWNSSTDVVVFSAEQLCTAFKKSLSSTTLSKILIFTKNCKRFTHLVQPFIASLCKI